MKVPEEYVERWLCPVCQWNSWEAPGVENIEKVLDQKTEANSRTLREARVLFQGAREAGTVADDIVCGSSEFERFDEKPADTEVQVADEDVAGEQRSRCICPVARFS